MRAGLSQPRQKEGYFVQKTLPLGTEQNFRWDKALAAAEANEDEELIRKMVMSHRKTKLESATPLSVATAFGVIDAWLSLNGVIALETMADHFKSCANCYRPSVLVAI